MEGCRLIRCAGYGIRYAAQGSNLRGAQAVYRLTQRRVIYPLLRAARTLTYVVSPPSSRWITIGLEDADARHFREMGAKCVISEQQEGAHDRGRGACSYSMSSAGKRSRSVFRFACAPETEMRRTRCGRVCKPCHCQSLVQADVLASHRSPTLSPPSNASSEPNARVPFHLVYASRLPRFPNPTAYINPLILIMVQTPSFAPSSHISMLMQLSSSRFLIRSSCSHHNARVRTSESNHSVDSER